LVVAGVAAAQDAGAGRTGPGAGLPVSGARALQRDAGAAPGEALLLGISGDDALSTLRVTESGVEVLGAGLAVPTQTGWLRVSEVGSQFDSSLVVTRGESPRTVAERAGKKREGRSRSPDGCTGSSAERVLAATPTRLLYEEFGTSMCHGDLHAQHTRRAVALSLGKAGKGGPVAIDEVLGQAGREALDRATGYDERQSYGEYDPSAWGFNHRDGAWRVVVYDRPTNPNAELTPLTVEFPAPAAMVGAERLPSTWDALHAAHPEAVDAIGAPDGRFLVLLTAEAIVALGPDGSELGQVKVHAPKVVMTQWAMGEANVARWRREARAALAR
jgi:hypothetical protein